MLALLAVLGPILNVLAPLLEPLANAIGTSFNDYLARKRAEQTSQDLGRVTAERDAEKTGREATERELEAAQNAPQSVDDAIKRLDEGTA